MTMKPPAGSSDAEFAAFDALRDEERTLVVIGRPVPLVKGVLRPPVTWEALAPGLTFPVLEYVVTPAAVAWYARTIVAPFLGTAPAAGDFVPPLFFADEPMQCINTLFARSGKLHAGNFIEALAAVPVGATVRSAARVTERYERSNRQYYEVECVISIHDSDRDQPAVRVRATLVI
jgi:hypothetical protein